VLAYAGTKCNNNFDGGNLEECSSCIEECVEKSMEKGVHNNFKQSCEYFSEKCRGKSNKEEYECKMLII